MSLEAITEIREVEERMERAKAEARAQAQKMVADAERDGKALLQQGRDAAAKAEAEALRKAEEAAAGRREAILAGAGTHADEHEEGSPEEDGLNRVPERSRNRLVQLEREAALARKLAAWMRSGD